MVSETTIYWLRHEYADESGDVNVKSIGMFRTQEAAAQAKDHASTLPGFCDYPDDFVIEPVALNQSAWAEGFDVAREESDAEARAALALATPKAVTALRYHIRPAPDFYWIYELRRGNTSLGCEVGRSRGPRFAEGLAEAVAFQRALDDCPSLS